MDRQALVEEVKVYFSQSDHWHRLCAALQGDQDPQGSHVHAYVDTSVHPNSMEKLMAGYFERMGWPSARKIDHMAPKKGMGSLHGVEPEGKPHFDFQWFFNKGIGLKACDGGESGCNLLVWNRWYIDSFYRQFPFRQVGAEEEKALAHYFKSEHFLNGMEFPIKPTTNHMHINIHSSIHPDYIQKYAEAAIAGQGWKLYYTCPNVYLADGKNYRGKLVFMCQDPEVVFDIGWLFTPDVIIEPAMEKWIFEANPGYDVWTSDMLAEVMDEDYVRLSDEEIQAVLDSCRFPV